MTAEADDEAACTVKMKSQTEQQLQLSDAQTQLLPVKPRLSVGPSDFVRPAAYSPSWARVPFI